MNTRRALKWLAVAFVIFYILTQPTEAGNTVGSTLDQIKVQADNLALFVQSIG